MKMKLAVAVLLASLTFGALAQGSQVPFTPSPGGRCKDYATGAAASLALPINAGQVQVYLTPSVLTYANFSLYGNTETVGNGVQLPAGVVVVLSAPLNYASFDYVSATSGTMNICVGQGY